MDSIIVGTAGHIDHGKTALVKALTGHDTDTLAEEKRRGISINLGFANFKLPSGRVLGIVDVPGHEKFIKNMLAGATGIDVALIIIAANEGIMPQTQEHIDILGYLNIQKSLIVLTKIDLVDEEFKELVIEDIELAIAGTFLAGTKIVQVDSLSKRGFEHLIEALDELTKDVNKRSFTKNPRMNIDRIFSVKGHGTVVTGTLMEGVLRTEDEVMVYPPGIAAKVRNLQVHDCDVPAACAGQRTAINISGVAVDEIQRGDTVAFRDSVYVTDRIDVRFSIVKNTRFELGKYYQLKFYVGAAEEVASFIPITAKKVKAGDTGYAQIQLEHKLAVLKGDCFVLRTISPVTTIGGGVIVDPQPAAYRKISEELVQAVRRKDSASADEIVEQYIRQHPFTDFAGIAGFLNRELEAAMLQELIQEQRIYRFDKQYVHMDFIAGLQYEIEDWLQDYHQKYSLRRGMPKAELLEKSTVTDKKQFEMLLAYFSTQQVVKTEQNLVCLYEFVPSLSPGQQRFRDEMEAVMTKSGYTLLTARELTGGNKAKQQVLEFMLLDGAVVLPGQYILSKKMYEQAREIVKTLYREQGIIKLPDVRDALNASRKYALMILERFDQEKYTRRQGEDRVLYRNNK